LPTTKDLDIFRVYAVRSTVAPFERIGSGSPTCPVRSTNRPCICSPPLPSRCQNGAELENGSERVRRGGSFSQGGAFLANAVRYSFDPTQPLADVGVRRACGF
jgi:hypothetical protein